MKKIDKYKSSFSCVLIILVLSALYVLVLACGGGGEGDEYDALFGSGPAVTNDTAAGNQTPTISITPFNGVQRGDITVSFTISDAEEDPCAVTFGYSSDGGLSWNEATLSGEKELYQAAADGTEYSFIWDSLTDGVGVTKIEEAIVRLRVGDGTTSSEYSKSEPFTVNNYTNDAPVCTLTSPTGTQSGLVTISYNLVDGDSDNCSVKVEYSVDGGTTYYTATKGTGGDELTTLSATPEGIDHTFVWDTLTDNLGTSYPKPTAQVRITPNDGYEDGAEVISTQFSIYNLTSGTFVFAGSMNDKRSWHRSVLLNDGRVLITGGLNYRDSGSTANFNKSAEIYSPFTGKFDQVGDMSQLRELHFAVTLTDGKVLVGGGQKGNNIADSSCDIFDPATNEFTYIGDMSEARRWVTAHRLADGTVFIIGGWSNISGVLQSTEVYNPVSGTFVAGPDMTIPRSTHKSVVLSDGRILVVGGWNGAASINSAEIYDPNTDTFTAVDNTLSPGVYVSSAATLGSGKVIVAGGHDGATQRSEAYEFDAALGANGQFTAVGGLATARYGLGVIALPDGSALVIGGQNTGNSSYSSTELYDINAQTFSSGANMFTARSYFGEIIQLQDGNFFISGGAYGTTTSISKYAEIYVP